MLFAEFAFSKLHGPEDLEILKEEWKLNRAQQRQKL